MEKSRKIKLYNSEKHWTLSQYSNTQKRYIKRYTTQGQWVIITTTELLVYYQIFLYIWSKING